MTAAPVEQALPRPNDPDASPLLRELVDVLRLSLGREPVPVAVAETAAALGAVSAHAGRSVATLVAEVLDLIAPLRTVDPMAPAFDVALRAAVDGHQAQARTAAPLGSARDPVSGLLGRSAFLEAMERYVAAAERSAPPAVVLVKPVLAAGDSALRADLSTVRFAATLRQCARAGDVIGRLSADCFAVLFAAPTESRGRHIARRVAARCADWEPRVGVARLDRPERAHFLLAAAESAIDRATAGTPLQAADRDDLVEAEEVVLG